MLHVCERRQKRQLHTWKQLPFTLEIISVAKLQHGVAEDLD